MRYFYYIFIIILLSSCSFDNKTGIWKNDSIVSEKPKNDFKIFKTINSISSHSQKVIPIDKKFKFKELNSEANYSWEDIYFSKNNNFKNFKINGNFELTFKGKKISSKKIDNLLFKNDYFIFTDQSGNIIVFSKELNKVITKYNFYKKRYKKIKKKLNIIIENNLLYVSDNLGYLYAFDYTYNRIVWAKNYKVPFRSNIKIHNNKIITSNQNNTLYFLNKKNGEKISEIPTEETVLKNQFINNLSLDNDFSFFINTFGSLYAINNESMRIMWFLNLSKSLDLNQKTSFFSSPIVSKANRLVISTKEFIYVISQQTGSIIHKINISSNHKPVILDDYIFIITSDKFLTTIKIDEGKIIYSYDLNKKISDFLNIKKKEANFKNLMILNSKLVVFLENSFILIFKINGELEQIRKLPTKISSSAIIIDNSILYLDNKNRLSAIN